MDALTLAPIVANVEALLIATVVAVGTGGPGLIFAIYRWRKTAPEEREALVAKIANETVTMMDVTLKAAAREREELLRKCERLERRCDGLEARVAQLEDAWPSDHPLPSPA